MSAYSTSRYFNTLTPNIALKYYNDTLFLIDNEDVLFIFDSNYELKSKTKLIKNSEKRHSYCSAYSIINGMVSIPNDKTLILAEYVENKITPRFKKEVHIQEIMLSEFSNNGDYLVSSGAGGRVFIFDCKTKAIRYTFPYLPDYCSCATFSSLNIFVFLGYYNNENVLLNLTNDKLYQFKHDVPILCAKFFDDDKKLFMSDKSGNSIIFDCISYEIINKKALFNDWVSCVTLTENNKFIMAGTRQDKLYLLDPHKNMIVKMVELQNSGITCIDVNDDTLFLGFEDTTVHTIDLGYKKDDFSVHVELKEYAEAKEILDSNVFLLLSPDIERFKAGFEDILIQAKEFITKGRIDEALKIVKPFMDDSELRKKVDLLFMQQDHIASFIEAVENKNITKAYELAKKYVVISSLGAFTSLEKQWESTFAKARKILEEDDLRGKNKARELLEPYAKIAQKSELVSQLLNNVDKFAQAESFIKKQDFQSYFKLTNSFAFLKETLLYQKVKALAQSLYAKSLISYSKEEYVAANKLFTQVCQFPEFKVKAQKEINKIKAFVELEDAIKENNRKRVYSLSSEFPFLQFNDHFIKYNQTFEQDIRRAAHQAQYGSISAAITILGDYMELPALKNKIDTCLKQGYLRELREANICHEDIEQLILIYKSLFGLDNEIKNIFTQKGHEKEYQYFARSNASTLVKLYPKSLFNK